MQVPVGLCEEYLEEFEQIYDMLPRQLIHRDPNPSTVIRRMSGGKEVWGFIDFELSERNIRIYDPCYAATAIFSEWFMAGKEREVTKWPDVYKNIMTGYDRVVGLTEEERRAVPYVILTNQLICVAWFADQGKYEEMYRANIKMTEWIFAHFEELRLM